MVKLFLSLLLITINSELFLSCSSVPTGVGHLRGQWTSVLKLGTVSHCHELLVLVN